MLLTWMYAAAYMMHVYFDFSGYSDMAIGLGRIMGFRFAENFNYPFISGSLTEFWRRWHISLSTWFRDYVYIPLGGSRRGTARTVRNICSVWLCTGFWHGASWNFILWGLPDGRCLEKSWFRQCFRGCLEASGSIFHWRLREQSSANLSHRGTDLAEWSFMRELFWIPR